MGLGFKGWKCTQKLHTKEGWACATNWIGEIMKNAKTVKYVILGFIFIMAFLFGQAEASYKFPYPERESITMDVDKVNGGGGTWRCPSVQACYIKVLEAEARGATHYCNSITIKRDGRIIWWRKYR